MAAIARERQTRIFVYATEANAIADTNGTEYTDGIVAETLRYEQTIMSALPGFGEANASMFECEIADTTDLTGKWIRCKYGYYATESTTTVTWAWFFLGKVDECKYDKHRLTRKLVAYDKMYELRSVDISAWWTTYWANKTANVSVYQVCSDMCANFGISLVTGSFRNSFNVFYTGQKGRNLGGCAFTDMLRYIGELQGYYWAINSSGSLVAVPPQGIGGSATIIDLDGNIDGQNTDIGDADLETYGTMTAYDGADIIYTSGTTEPTYTIQDNILLYARTTAQIASVLDNTKGYLSYISGLRPATIECIVSDNGFLSNLRDVVSYDDDGATRTSVVSKVEVYGPQLINARLNCTSYMQTGTQYSAAMSKTANDIQAMGIELTYKVNSDSVIEAINLEAHQGVTINADKVDIAGATIFTSGRLSEQSLDAAYDANGAAASALTSANSYTDTATADMATNTSVSATYATKASAAAEEQYIYISKAAGTTSQSGTTTWVTRSTNTQNAWTTTRPEFSTSYPVLFRAKQTKTVSGTVTCTTPVVDTTTTIIDGGNIITGTIVSSKIGAGEIKTANIDASAVTANKIATGAITAEKIDSSVDMATNAGVAGTYATKANSVKREQRIYRKNNSSTAPTAPTSWITSTSVTSTAWTTKRMSYDTSYPYLWTCLQTETNDGTVSCSTVLLDDTLTVIDGGKIITGTVDANQIKAGAITTEKINSSVDMATNAGVAGTYATKAAAASEEQFIYISKASGTTSVSGTTTWVTSSADTQNAWRIRRPTYNSSYPIVFVAKQTKTVSGTVTCSTPVIDNTTTVIDGGNIITGSIATNKIDVTDLRAFNATIGGWTIDTSAILKEVTIDGYVYQVCLYAPATPTTGNFAVGVRKRATDSQTWTYLSYFNYGGKLYSQNAEISGKITATSGTIGGLTINNNSIETVSEGETIDNTFVLSDAGTIVITKTFKESSINLKEENVVDSDGFMSTRKDDISEDDQWVDSSGFHSHHRYDDDIFYDRVAIMSASEYNTDGPAMYLSDYQTQSGTVQKSDEAIYSVRSIRLYDSKNAKETKLNHSELVVGNTDVLAALPKVLQTVTNTSAAYPLLFGESTVTLNSQATTKTEGARISGAITVNPNTGTINARRIHTGTTSQYGRFVLGNSIANGTAGCSHGEMYIYGKGDKYVRFVDKDNVLTANREVYFPNQSGYLVVDAVTSGSGTRTTSGAASGSTAAWSRTGKIVSVNVSSLKAASTSNPTELFSGLPKATQDTYFICQATATATYRHAMLKITTDGTIVNAGDALSNSVAVYGNVMYITSD